MPRKSAAALSVVPPAPKPHPKPPKGMPASQQEIWRTTVNCRVPDYFDAACTGLLVEYCRCVDRADLVETLLRRTDPELRETYDRLCGMAQREAKLMGDLAAKLRIAPSATRRQEHVIRKVPGPRPWET
jgi:hypothetical protein